MIRHVIHPDRDASAEPPAVEAADNPGVRVVPEFCDEEEAAAVVQVCRELFKDLGVSHIAAQHRSFYVGQMQHLVQPNKVNMLRVTGRPERQDWMPEQQRVPEWGYGDDFTKDKLPAPLRVLVERLENSTDFDLGPLRDVTLNYRQDYFLRLDPHVDPLLDGKNIFIVGFLSPQVLTLTSVGHPHSVMMDQRQVSAYSWAPGRDLDVLMRPRTLVHLHGKARDELNHGVRLGVDAKLLGQLGVKPPEAPAGCLYDWWGSNRHPVPRGEERLSVVFAFADKGEKFDKAATAVYK